MLNITPILQTKLMSFVTSTTSRDASDIMCLVEMHTSEVDASKLDQTHYFLEIAELDAEAGEAVRRVLKY